jgi:undecaprenol kinase/diacylglycerol kinase (ATP)
MTDKKNSTLKNRLNSFKYAFNGLGVLFRDEPNARIHAICAVAAVVLGFALQISLLEWIAIVISIGLVIAFELINSAIEAFCNHVTSEQNQNIKKIKDLSAAAVLVSAIAAFIIGIIIFLPKIIVLCCRA